MNALLRKSAKLRTAPQQVRIIGGQWKRTPLPVPHGVSLRPTPDRMRETVFNWIHHLIQGNWLHMDCLDAFAGTGALGWEAASRGARHVVMIDNHAPAITQLGITREKLHAKKVEIMRGDALGIMHDMQQHKMQFDLIFLDPPYHQNWLTKLLPTCQNLLRQDGLLYAESEAPLTQKEDMAWQQNWEIVRTAQAGQVCCHLLRAQNLPIFQA